MSRCRRQTRGCGSTPGSSARTGRTGFWRRHWPDEHFRTAAATSPLIAEALDGGGRPASVDAVVDVGAGRGELLRAVADSATALRVAGIDLRPRPDALPAEVGLGGGPVGRPVRAVDHRQADRLLGGDDPVLVIAAEWLDDLPCPVVHQEADGWREVVVERGRERAARAAAGRAGAGVGRPVVAGGAAGRDRV